MHAERHRQLAAPRELVALVEADLVDGVEILLLDVGDLDGQALGLLDLVGVVAPDAPGLTRGISFVSPGMAAVEPANSATPTRTTAPIPTPM